MSNPSTYWLAMPGEEPIGPLTRNEIQARVASSPPDADWQICEEGSEHWRSASTLEGSTSSPSPPSTWPRSVNETGVSNNQSYMMLMHLSLLSTFILPLAGVLVPVALWLAKKNQDEAIDRQGREIVNWVIFQTIAAAISFLLVFFFIGIPMLLVLAILGIIFPILGAVKATEGEFYAYPMLFRVLH